MDGLKQRIIGALVLICLAIIFVPMLFDEPHDKQTTKTIEIPNKPPYPVMTIEQPKQPAVPAAGDTSAPAAQDNSQVPASATTGTATESSSDTANAAPTQDNGSTTAPATMPGTTTSGTPTTTAQPATPAPAPQPTSKPQPQPEPQSAQPATSPAKAAASDEKPEFSQSLKGAWVVQLGSFGSTKNAEHLRDSVRSKGYPAYLQTAHAGGKTLTRVFSGPFVQKTDAEAAKTKLDKAFHIKSLVMAGDK